MPEKPLNPQEQTNENQNQEFQYEMLPADLFEPENHIEAKCKKIKKVFRIGEYIVLIREGINAVTIYDKNGKLVKERNIDFINQRNEESLNQSLLEVLSDQCQTRSANVNYLSLTKLTHYIIKQLDIDRNNYGILLQKIINIFKSKFPILTIDRDNEFKQNNVHNCIQSEFKLINLDPEFFTKEEVFYENGIIISFRGDQKLGNMHIVVCIDENGNTLPINQWQEYQFKSSNEYQSNKSHLPNNTIGIIDSYYEGDFLFQGENYKMQYIKAGGKFIVHSKLDEERDLLEIPSVNGYIITNPKYPHLVAIFAQPPSIVLLNTNDGVNPKRWIEMQIPLPFPGVKSFKFDPKGNYIIFSSSDGNDPSRKLIIFDIEKKKCVREISDVQGDFDVDNEGNIFICDKNNNPRVIKTNFLSLESKKEKEEKERQQGILKNIVSLIRENAAVATTSEQESVPAEIKTKQHEVYEYYLERIRKIENIRDLQTLDGKINQTKDKLFSEGLSGETIDQIFAPTMEGLFNREREIIGTEVNTIISMSRQRIENLNILSISDFEQLLIVVKAGLEKAQQHNIEVAAEELTSMRDLVESELRKQWEDNRTSCVADLDEMIGEIIDEIDLIKDIHTLNNFKDQNTVYQRLIERLNNFRQMIGSELVLEYKNNIKAALAARKEYLALKEKQENDRKEIEHQNHLHEIDLEIQDLDDEIQQKVTTDFDLERFLATSETLRNVRHNIETLESEDDKSAKTAALEYIFERHMVRIQNADVLRTSQDGHFAIFGSEKFPVYEGNAEKTKITWAIGYDIETNPSNSNKDKFIFYFESSEGEKKYLSEITAELKPVLNGSKVPNWLFRRDFEMGENNPSFYLNIIKNHLEETSNSASNLNRIPKIPSELVFTQEIMDSLEQMAKLAKMQLGLDRDGIKRKGAQGMLLLEGDTGTGKDILIDIFAAKTNRPLYIFDCSRWTQNREFSYTYEFDGRTIRVDSEVRKALSTPGAILYFNEFNQLSEAAQKFLNSLLSHRRQIAGAFNNTQPTQDDVLIMGSMNGRKGYFGTEIEASSVSRIRYLEIDYLEEKIDIWACNNETISYCRKLTPLQHLNNDDLQLLWDYVVNKNIDEAQRSRLAELSTNDRITAITTVKNALLAQDRLAQQDWLYHYSESYAMAKLCNSFRNMKEEDFKKLWDYIINNKIDNGAGDLVTEERRKLIIAFKLVVQVANDIRRQFRKTHSGEDIEENEDVKFIASLRETLECAKEIDYHYDLFENGEDLAVHAMTTVLLPKIARPMERTYIRTLFSQGVTIKQS